MASVVEGLHAGIHGISHEQIAFAVGSNVCRKVKLARSRAALAELGDILAIQIEREDCVSKRIHDEQAVAMNGEARGTLQAIRGHKQKFPFLRERNNGGKARIRDENDSISLCDGDRRNKANGSNPVPAL